MRNPLRDEAAAFQFVLITLGAGALIVLASWISPWLGTGMFLALCVAGVVAVRGGRRGRARTLHVEKATVDDTRRVLVVANETVAGRELLDTVKARAVPGSVVHVVCPALNSRVRTWTSDEDAAREQAQARLDGSIGELARAGVTAAGEVGDGDPVQAVEDALRAFPADEIVISTHPPGRSAWLERGVVDAVRQRFDVPVTHVVVDLGASVSR